MNDDIEMNLKTLVQCRDRDKQKLYPFTCLSYFIKKNYIFIKYEFYDEYFF